MIRKLQRFSPWAFDGLRLRASRIGEALYPHYQLPIGQPGSSLDLKTTAPQVAPFSQAVKEFPFGFSRAQEQDRVTVFQIANDLIVEFVELLLAAVLVMPHLAPADAPWWSYTPLPGRAVTRLNLREARRACRLSVGEPNDACRGMINPYTYAYPLHNASFPPQACRPL